MGDTGPRWQLDSNAPPAADQMFTQQVVIEPPSLRSRVLHVAVVRSDGLRRGGRARDWHAYALEQNDEIEAAWASGRTLEIVIGLTACKIGQWSGTYSADEHDHERGAPGAPRPLTVEANTPADYRDESCAVHRKIRRHAGVADSSHPVQPRLPLDMPAAPPTAARRASGALPNVPPIARGAERQRRRRSGTGAAQLSAQATGLQRHPVNHPSQGASSRGRTPILTVRIT